MHGCFRYHGHAAARGSQSVPMQASVPAFSVHSAACVNSSRLQCACPRFSPRRRHLLTRRHLPRCRGHSDLVVTGTCLLHARLSGIVAISAARACHRPVGLVHSSARPRFVGHSSNAPQPYSLSPTVYAVVLELTLVSRSRLRGGSECHASSAERSCSPCAAIDSDVHTATNCRVRSSPLQSPDCLGQVQWRR